MDYDFGYSQNGNGNNAGSDVRNDTNGGSTNITTGKIDHNFNGEPVDNLDGKNTDVDNANANKNNGNEPDNTNNNNGEDDNKNNEPLQPGTTIEVEGQVYTIDNSGNAIDKNGNIFKESKDVNDWIKGFDEIDENNQNDISIDSIREAIGVDITDDNDKPIEFENTPAGIKAYIDAVIDTAKEEHYETAINTLYQKYPILNDVLNYYVANGNSLDGFGEIPDRSNIVIDDTNEEQQEAIIRTAWNERGQKGDVNGYIEYLKSSGTLLATAKEELAGLQEADKQYREELAAEAERKENERIERLEKYWAGVHDVIKSRKIAGYQIPESIVINRNGQKLSVTPDDFYNYIYRVDKDGKSAYERDLAAETSESRRDDEILRAYLKFVGGDYSSLVGMAINKEQVNTLKLRAKQRNSSSIRITKPNTTNKEEKGIDVGYK